MKKVISLILALVMCLSLCACDRKNDTPETTLAPTAEATEETQAVENIPNWVLDNVVDDFGDATGEQVIKGVFTGTFSNTATSNSDLTVLVFYDFDDDVFYFRLLEYTDRKATYLSGDTITFKTKLVNGSSNDITEYTLKGNGPNGDLILTNSSKGNKTYNTSLTLRTGLYYGGDLKCVIEIGSSKYSFTIYSDGFGEMFDLHKKR